MAEKRMFSKTIIDSDAFLDMPMSTQCLYFHLCMRADDEGFINNPKKIQRMIGASEDDLKVLSAKKFIIPFETGIVVIKHWKIHNYIQKDRFKPTNYADEKSQLVMNENGSYSLDVNGMYTGCIQNVSKTEAQISIDKNRLEQNSLDEIRTDRYIDAVNHIIEYLNSKTGSSYRPKTPQTIKLITARIKEGFTEEDFLKVIDNMVLEWGRDKTMSQYLRPQTLFGTKFESYLNRRHVDSYSEVDSWV